MDLLGETFGERVISQELTSRITRFKYLRLPFLRNAHRKVYVKHPHYLEEVSGMQFQQFLYGSFDLCLETYSHYVRHA
jgi:hypothetical protein